MIVHFPVALLAVAAVFYLLNRKQKYEQFKPAADKLLLGGAISAIVACILGLMLADGGGYDEDAIRSHKWTGIILALISSLGWVVATRNINLLQNRRALINRVLMGGVLLLVFLTGHYGGNLTHGSEYLFENAPQFVRSIAGFPPKAEPRPPVTNLDSAHVYLDLVEPVLRRRCFSCHSESKKKGGLLMTSYEGLLEGGKSGAAVAAHDLKGSELFNRITLDPVDDDFMPPDGKTPLTDEQVNIIEWWIEQGAPKEGRLAQQEISDEMRPMLASFFGLDGSGSGSAFALPAIDPLDESAEEAVRQAGFMARTLAAENYYLDVDLSSAGRELTDDMLKALLKVKEHVTWLNLAGTSVKDEHLETLAQFTNLTKLNLSRNPDLSSQGTTSLQSLENLEYLNLYATGVDDATLDHVKSLPRLRSLFLWQTKVTPDKAAEVRNARPGLNLDTGELEV